MNAKYHHGDLKEELIRVGLQMIQKDGINGLSLRKLSAKCGVSEAAPYSHFKSKEDLLNAMQEYVVRQLQECLKKAYQGTKQKDSPRAILNMGKAYVLFFMRYPEYYTFLFTQADVRIDLSTVSKGDSIAPFQYYREKVYLVYRKEGFSEKEIKYGLISMWAKVHGIAAIASMQNVGRDFEWEDVLEEVLAE